jgi:nucleotidyltransferase substrate binding protein (TIGR01987 family)
MSPEKLILTPYQKALKSLEAALAEKENEFVRDATIPRVEYTYQLGWKVMKRHLKWAGNDQVDSLTKRDLFREAARTGLIADAELWFDYNQARNQTSHTYEPTTAEEVYEAARKFASDARALLVQLEKHHG